MLSFHDQAALRTFCAAAGRIALVPTMGNLHAGHTSLIGLARQHADTVIASIYVNPLQFGAEEDFARYPRTLQHDVEQLEQAGADAVFLPDDALMKTAQQRVFVEPSRLAADLCGKFRPGHFRGVTTIVLKLLNLVRPEVLVLGKKDFQQWVIVREMLEDLLLPIRLLGVATVRAEDGLALSSRNQYLSASERSEAPRLYRSLQTIAARADPQSAVSAAHTELQAAGWRVDYIAVRDAQTLQAPLPQQPWVVLGAAWLGATRLIDNVEILN